ncbi:MAG: hypothetical protein AAGE59_06950 [Cyanobacteria bacterium P01_F01_bin.86]
MSRYLLGALLGLIALLTLYSTGALLRINRGTTASREDTNPIRSAPTAVESTENVALSDLEGAGQYVIRQTSDEALDQITAQRDTTQPEPEPAPPTQPQVVESEPEPRRQNNQRAIPALW